jgi:cation diffusion facilitator family transporter
MNRETHTHEMNARAGGTEDRARMIEGQRITWISVVVNVVLTAMQLVVGFAAHSQSLIADAMHTLSDIVADGFVLVANRKGAEAADDEHPYGHGRYETAASLVLGLLLAGTGAGILVAATGRLQALDSAPPVGIAAMWAALITLAAKEGLFRYMLKTAERLRSPMLMANAWHARADALSSLVVAAGIGGALLGFNFADALAAIIVGAMIVRAGLHFAWDAIRELIDTGLSAEEVAAIRRTISDTSGVLGLHELRTRRMAHKVLVDAHVQVNPRISVSEGHRIAESVRRRILEGHEEVLDVLVHIDAENDLHGNAAVGLPDRPDLLVRLADILAIDVGLLDHTLLHYLGSRVEASVFLPAGKFSDQQLLDIEQRASGALATEQTFASITVHHQVAP